MAEAPATIDLHRDLTGWGHYSDKVMYRLPLEWLDKIIEAWLDTEYDYYGVRVIASGSELDAGDIAPVSHYIPDGEFTDDELYGASAIQIEQNRWNRDEDDIARFREQLLASITVVLQYEGPQLVLLGAESVSEGNDPGEIEMRDAVVLAAFDLGSSDRFDGV